MSLRLRAAGAAALSLGLLLAVSSSSDALVLCMKRRTGRLSMRKSACRAKEVQVDPAELGIQGPAGPPGLAAWERPCPPDSARVGPVCVDKYEASAWIIPAESTGLLAQVRNGTATLADLTAGGATLLGCERTPDGGLVVPGSRYPATFPSTGNWTEPVYAASVAGVLPSNCITWFMAEQACRLSGKRLLTNQEWQAAAAGTPDSGRDDGSTLCNVNAQSVLATPAETGSRPGCVSRWGVFDMVGNVAEWVADWADGGVATAEEEGTSTCQPWMGDDLSCFGGDGSRSDPSAVTRGGTWASRESAGVFAISGDWSPGGRGNAMGFRCAR